MTRHQDHARTVAALRELDPAPASTLTEEERRRADAILARILTGPDEEPARTGRDRLGRRRGRRTRVLVPAGLFAAAAVAVPTALSSGSAFGSWTATPSPLSPAQAETAATACRAEFEMNAELGGRARVAIGERRGGWTYVLVIGADGEGACLTPDADLVGDDKVGERGFGSFSPDPPEAPAVARDSIDENESMVGSVSLPGRLSLGGLSLGHRDGWFVWVSGFAGRDVTGITVHPPVGPDVEASLQEGRYSAWWPAGDGRGDDPGVSGAWSYTVTLADGSEGWVEVRP